MKRCWLCLLCALLWLWVPAPRVRAAPQRPVVVIPGLLGTKLCRAGTTEVVWGSGTSLSNFSRLALPIDSAGRAEPLETCGVLDAVRLVGPFKFHQYDQLLDTLHRFGYVDGQTLFVFAYDWRQSNFESAKKLADFVRQHVGERQFDIVAHSMGGLVARVFLADAPAGAHVARLVTMGTPHRGSLKVLRVADSGWSWWENALAGGLGNVRDTLLTFSSVFELLPSYKDCCVVTRGQPSGTSTFEPLSPAVWESLALLPERFRTPEGRRAIRRSLEGAARLHALLKAPLPPRVRFAPLVTGLLETEWRAHLDPQTGRFVRWDTNFGDGTVYEGSAANMQLFDARPSDVEHQRIFNSDSARQVLRWALLSGVDPTAGPLTTDYRATIKAGAKGIDVARVDLNIAPNPVRAGSRTEVTLQLTGQRALTEFDFPVTIVLHGPQGEIRLPTSSNIVSGDDLSTQRIFRGAFTAPSRAGTYRVSASLPGLEPVEELFEVMP